MISFEELQKYLPKYLSAGAEQKLFDELVQFPDNIDKRFYSYRLRKEAIIYQGDGIKDVMVINLPELVTGNAPVMVISNTCDINSDNFRYFPARIIYAPIFNLSKYEINIVKRKIKDVDSIKVHIDSIRKQFVSNVFYLPTSGELPQESIVLLDRLCNLPVEYVPQEDIINRKLFTLSDYGNFVFLFKLSIHFTRMREGIERGME